jgi:hypothetical protein
MGRTLPTIVQLIHSEEDAWRSFRRALRKEDQELFDRLWVYCRTHAQAAAMANREIPFETLTMAMLLGLLRELDKLVYELRSQRAAPHENSRLDI